jgi:hypothetical protein
VRNAPASSEIFKGIEHATNCSQKFPCPFASLGLANPQVTTTPFDDRMIAPGLPLWCRVK